MRQAVVVVSHGTVDDLGDLAAFATNVRRGHPPGPELVAELRRRYEAIGGKSPLNAVNALLASKLERRLGVPVRWANRLWKPYTGDVLRDLGESGTERVTLLPLAQHSVHVYEADARVTSEAMGLELVCVRPWGRDPDLCSAFADRIVAALRSLADPSRATVLMTAHSLPVAVIASGDPYEADVRAAADTIAALVRSRAGASVEHALAFQSQGLGARGSDGRLIAWLGPDLRASLDDVAARGGRTVVLAPVGFLADHVEILYDLDIEARAMAEQRGLTYARAASLDAGDDLVEVLVKLARPLLAAGSGQADADG